MKYNVTLEATVEAESAEAAKNLFNHFADNKEGVISRSVGVTPSKKWAVVAVVPVYYDFALVVNAETESEAEEIAIQELMRVDVIEEFVKGDIVTDYQYHVCAFDTLLESINAVDTEDCGSRSSGTEAEVSAA
jgi:hypothetical protein